jgi:diguanylate cyclase (GGDEF)-like protein
MNVIRPDMGDLKSRLNRLLQNQREPGSPDVASDPVLQQSGSMYSLLIRTLAQLDYDEQEAERHWQAISIHRQRIAELLGRDPGLPVAVLDYFFNLERELTNPKAVEIAAWEAMERSAVTDGLTGLFNRPYFHSSLKVEAKRSRRYDLNFSLVMLDLDNFKQVNDQHGHVVGDEALATVSELIRQNVREIDVPCRYGGEEFALILPETDRAGAFIVTERIRADVESVFRQRSFNDRTVALTVSGGLAVYPSDSLSEEELLVRADQALYLSKHQGKNRVTVHPAEKRRSVRFDARKELMLLPGSQPGGDRQPTIATKNLSRNGALVESQVPLSVGSDLLLCFKSRQPSRDYTLRGKVVRLQEVKHDDGRRYNVGIAFFAENEEEVRRLDWLTHEIYSRARAGAGKSPS